MQQLSGLDALFVRCEQGNTYLHIGPVMIYAPPAAGKGALPYKNVRRLLEQRLCHSAVFRRKLVEVPWKLDNPYWIEDPNFNLKNHLHQTRLRKPGNLQQFVNALARIHSRPLDRAHPLWMVHLIYGLDDIAGIPAGSFALYFKAHHASMDGATGAGIIEAIHDAEPQAASDLPIDDWKAERTPSALGFLSRALVNNVLKPFKLAGVAGQTVTAVQRIMKGTREHRFSSLGSRERTRFNGPVGPNRVVGFVSLSLAEVKQLRQRVPGATVNDVALSIVAGAMRHYLHAKGELPGNSLIAGIPVNVRARRRQETAGNVISLMTVALCTDKEDPLERLECIHQQSVEAKAYHDELGPELLTSLSDSLPPYLVALCSKPVFATGVLGKMPPIVNTIVTNVPGPQKPLFFGGAKMTMITGLGPCTDGLGLFHSMSSYCDVITIGFQACPTMLPDPGVYTQCIQASWDELKLAGSG